MRGCLCPCRLQWPGSTIRPETEHFPLCSSDIDPRKFPTPGHSFSQGSRFPFRFPLLRFLSHLISSPLHLAKPNGVSRLPLLFPLTTTPSLSQLLPSSSVPFPPHPTSIDCCLSIRRPFPFASPVYLPTYLPTLPILFPPQSASPLPESSTLI